MPRIPLLSLLCFAVSSPAGSLHAQEHAELEVWQMISTYLTKEAEIALGELPEPSNAAAQREREFCAVVVQLSQQTVTEARIEDVERRLGALVAANNQDDIGRASLYLLGRVAQVFRATPDNALAATYYRQLIAMPDNDHWANLDRVKLALLEIYMLPAESPADRIAAVESLIPGVHDRITLRDLHRLAARGLMFYELDPARALEHLLTSDSIGGLRGMPAADQVVQIANLAWELGRKELSNTFREKLRDQYPRDARIYLLDQRAAGEPVPEGTAGGGQ